EHTSELQSRRDLVCRLLLEKKSDVCSDRKSTRLNSSHVEISYAVFWLKKKSRGFPSPDYSSHPQGSGNRLSPASEIERGGFRHRFLTVGEAAQLHSITNSGSLPI